MTGSSASLNARLDALAAPLRPADDPAVDAEVAALVASPGFDDRTEDETHRPYVTIDNEDSRDLDQALAVERDGDDVVVHYALADAAYYVRPGTALWARAQAMGSSFYFPGFSVPMLPAALSEGLVSLNPGVLRRALVFEMRVDPRGVCVATAVRRTRIRSRAKLSYAGVQRWFDGDRSDDRLADPAIAASLRAFAEVGRRRLAEAEARDVVPLQRLEAEVWRDPADPERLVAEPRARFDVEQWNEQVSLLTNMEGARMLRELGREGPGTTQPVYRVHLPPLSRRLDELEERLSALVAERGLDDVWRWQREPLADYLDRIAHAPCDGPDRERLLQAIHRQVRYTYRSSEFQARSGPHHALGVDGYSRMSSPMREIVGIFSHKELLEGLGLEPAAPADADVTLRAAVIDAANRSKSEQRAVEKAVDLMVLDQLLHADLDASPPRWRRGTIVGVRATRLYVSLDDCAVDLKVYTDDLAAAHEASFDERDGVALVGDGTRFVVGDAVEARACRWDEGRRRFVIGLRHAG